MARTTTLNVNVKGTPRNVKVNLDSDSVAKGIQTANDQLFFQSKAYIAWIAQDPGTGNPVVEVIQNSLGFDMDWIRVSSGYFTASTGSEGVPSHQWDSIAFVSGTYRDFDNEFEALVHSFGSTTIQLYSLEQGVPTDNVLSAFGPKGILLYGIFFGLRPFE